MKFAAIKGQMGIWRYYVSALSFGEIAKYVSPITKEISNSDSYSNLLQRAITNNVSSITDYLLLQPERMFNALVLAVYDGNPEWSELDMDPGRTLSAYEQALVLVLFQLECWNLPGMR